MPQSAAFCARDTLYALLCNYLVSGSRDLSTFNPLIDEKYRVIVADGITFKIVRKLPTQSRERPGVNLVFFDEHRVKYCTGAYRYMANVGIHIELFASVDPLGDERTLLKIQRKVEEAMYGGAIQLYDFDAPSPVGLGKNVWWEPMDSAWTWRDLTNLSTDKLVSKAKNLSVWWDEFTIT